MRLTYEQVQADRAKMEAYVCERIPGDGTTVQLEGRGWVGLIPIWDDASGWSLLLDEDKPGWVDLLELHRHFRRMEMTTEEWWDELEGELARSRVLGLEREVEVLRHELDQVGADGPHDYAATVDENGLPKEISTAEAAKILGVSKDTVLKLKDAGLLEYRKTGSPDSFRPVFAFTLRSVIELRTSYERDFPVPRQRPDPPRRRVKGERKYKHLNLDD
jgi:excisionase family DNA binding protein